MSLRHIQMPMRARLLAFSGGLALLVGVSCAERQNVFLEGDQKPSEFVPEDGGPTQNVEASLPESVPMCPVTTCTLPWATCPSSEFPCSTNLLTDDDNCGGCGIRCGGHDATTFSQWTCVDGQCQFSCEFFAGQGDCDGDRSNGCETSLELEDNCGACGHKCPAGQACQSGTCVGCAYYGLPDMCSGGCVDLANDDYNCGTCGTACDPTGPNLPGVPDDMYYGCAGGACGMPKCSQPNKVDCNGDPKDGCETTIHTNEHCRSCNDACPAGKVCGILEFTSEWACLCDPGETYCGLFAPQCRNLNDDPSSCGGCYHACPGLYTPHFEATCAMGTCGGNCEDGYADCNELLADGCEINTRIDNRNCGACGHACLPNQVCSQGKCQVTPCDAGAPEGPTK